MNTINYLQFILGRLERRPANLVRTELQIFFNVLNQDPVLLTVIRDIVSREQEANNIGNKVELLFVRRDLDDIGHLSFAQTPSARAALGYSICSYLLAPSTNVPQRFQQMFGGLASYFAAQLHDKGTPSWAQSMKVFVEVFLEPLVMYLSEGLDMEDKILAISSRYAQRSTWFNDKLLLLT